MKRKGEYSVQEAAKTSGLTVRTLHYYDEIGLLVPARTARGYRKYNDQSLLRLQQILLNREMGLSLEAIRERLDAPNFNHRQALLVQRDHLLRRVSETKSMLSAVDAALRHLDQKTEGTMDLFDGFDHEKYDQEVTAKWGDTDAFQESTRRTRNYDAKKWKIIKAESADWLDRLVECFEAGHAPQSADAMDLAEEHRLHIGRWFYSCAPAMHRGLGEMYVADSRFTSHYDQRVEGLVIYLKEAIDANADRIRLNALDPHVTSGTNVDS